jgi:RNA polymerase sigma-70 factor (ECF subfamily)
MEEKTKILVTKLFEENYDRIVRFIYTKTRNLAEAEDLAGEVFLKATKAISGYEERGFTPRAWLFKIAHNLTIDEIRKKIRRQEVALEYPDTVATDNDPSGIAEKRIVMKEVTEAMGSLTEGQREVLRLRFFAGLTSAETATLLGKNSGAVREMQRIAVGKLRSILVKD